MVMPQVPEPHYRTRLVGSPPSSFSSLVAHGLAITSKLGLRASLTWGPTLQPARASLLQPRSCFTPLCLDPGLVS